MASAAFFEGLKAFRSQPRESLVKLADRFDEVAEPLLTAGLMTTRGLALILREHIPPHIRMATLGAMMREDMRRFKKGDALVDKDELLKMAQDSEAFLLEFETEQRAAGLTPDARHTEHGQPAPVLPKAPPRPMEDRLGGRDIKDRLGTRADYTTDMRECNQCKKIGHIARNCPDLPRAVLPGPPPTRPLMIPLDILAAHKTNGAVCSACKKPGHVEAQCWATHLELLPTEFLKKRQAAMNVNNRKRSKASEYTSPNYLFQGMALTYHRAALAMMQRRSTRTPMPTRQARESAEQSSTRRVHFSPSPAADGPAVVNVAESVTS